MVIDPYPSRDEGDSVCLEIWVRGYIVDIIKRIDSGKNSRRALEAVTDGGWSGTCVTLLRSVGTENRVSRGVTSGVVVRVSGHFVT